MTIGSLFSGIGGLEIALESCGLGPVVWQCDSDPYARAVLATHWPAVRRYNDVREIDETAERPDIICGGFPCQDISNAGKRVGIDGERSGLWSEFARIIRVLRPRVVFVENVRPLLVRGIDRVLGDLADLGFDAEWEVFRASDVGAPHLRERVFVLAYRDGFLRGLQPRRGGGADWTNPTVAGDDRAQLADADRERWNEGHDGWSDAPGRTIADDGGPLADAYGSGRGQPPRHVGPGECAEEVGQREAQPGGRDIGLDVADASCARRCNPKDASADISDAGAFRGWRPKPERDGALADANGTGLGGIRRPQRGQPQAGLQDSPRNHTQRSHRFPPGPTRIADWNGPQPAIRRGDDGVPGRSHRLRLLGNSVVPQQAAHAWVTLSARAARSRTEAA